MKKLLIYIILGTLLFEVALSPLRGWVNFMLSGTVAYIVYATVLYLCLSKCKNLKPQSVLFAFLCGWTLLNLPVRIFWWDSTLVSLPEVLMHLAGIITGYILWKVGRRGKVVTILSGAILCAVFVWHYTTWLDYLAYGSVSGRTAPTEVSAIVFQDTPGQSVSLNDFRGKYLVLDFWSSSCGVCFREFPKVQRMFDKWHGREDIAYYSVFCRISKKGETIQTGAAILHERGFSFPLLSLDIEDPALKELGAEGFPTVIIIDPEGRKVLRSSAYRAKRYIDKLECE